MTTGRTHSRSRSGDVPQTEYIQYVPAPGAMKRIGKLHTLLYRATGGVVGGRVDGLNILLLTTVGRKTGRMRTVPLPYFRDAGRYLVIASYGGNEKNPAWFRNLAANPNVRLQIGFRSRRAHATIADEVERARLWTDVTAAFPRYLAYQAKTARTIAIVVLDEVAR